MPLHPTSVPVFMSSACIQIIGKIYKLLIWQNICTIGNLKRVADCEMGRGT